MVDHTSKDCTVILWLFINQNGPFLKFFLFCSNCVLSTGLSAWSWVDGPIRLLMVEA